MPFHIDIWNWIKEHKKGIVYGAGVGVIIYVITTGQGTPLFAADSPSTLDKVVTVATKWKYLIGLLLIGAGSGAILENIKKGMK